MKEREEKGERKTKNKRRKGESESGEERRGEERRVANSIGEEKEAVAVVSLKRC